MVADRCTDILAETESQNPFPILGPRLANLGERMRTWRPRRKRDLLKPGYGDRFVYYTQLFALFIAIVGALGVVLSTVQTAYAVIVAQDNSIEMAVDRVEVQMSALLNVTQQMLLAVNGLETQVRAVLNATQQLVSVLRVNGTG